MTYPLYQQLSDQLRADIEQGLRQPGQRMPSVRELCLARTISKSTVLAAYGQLEAAGLIESRPRSGYFVTRLEAQGRALHQQPSSNPVSEPLPVSTDQVIIDIMEKGAAFDILPNSNEDNLNSELRRSLARAYRQQSGRAQNYYNPPLGSHSLREKIVSRLHASGSHLQDDQLLITNGCQHALLLALMATTEPGDIVAIESPGFYGVIQLIEVLGLQIIELPSTGEHGVDVDVMEQTFARWPVAALIISPCYSTPTGSCLSDDNKQRVIKLCAAGDIAIIEDDIYGELHFGLHRPRSLHSFDQQGNVLLCSSFSKCLSRDLRIGWIVPGRFMEKVKRLKIVTALSTSSSLQEALADYLQRGLFDRSLRQRRANLARQCQQLQTLIPQLISCAQSWTQPQGGLSLWLELPANVDTTYLYHRAQAQGVIITPGALFTAQQNYQSFLRLSFNHPWSSERIHALTTIGQLISSHP